MFPDDNKLGIHAEPLGEGRHIYVSRAHTFGTDAFLLADFATPKKGEFAADLGTGCGIIPSLWLSQGAAAEILGVEIQPEACQLAERTISENGCSDRFSVLCADMRELAGKVERERYHLVTCNPPYFTGCSGYISPDPQRASARSELSCSIEDVCMAARYLVRYGGRFCMCHRPERLPDVICAMRAAGIEPKRMRLVHNRPEGAPWLVLLEGRRGGRPSLDILPPLVMRGADGGDSDELKRLYENYRTTRGSSRNILPREEQMG